eukprot:6196680-Pleurochrysis_carterae.AAC.3
MDVEVASGKCIATRKHLVNLVLRHDAGKIAFGMHVSRSMVFVTCLSSPRGASPRYRARPQGRHATDKMKFGRHECWARVATVVDKSC